MSLPLAEERSSCHPCCIARVAEEPGYDDLLGIGRCKTQFGQPLGNPRASRPALHTHTYRTILPWIAQDTQYWSLRYILGTVYSAKTEASLISPGEGQSALRMRHPIHQKLTNGRRLDHVADGKALDGFVLGRASTAVGAANGIDVATALLVSAV
jgi:hypothetical protein